MSKPNEIKEIGLTTFVIAYVVVFALAFCAASVLLATMLRTGNAILTGLGWTA